MNRINLAVFCGAILFVLGMAVCSGWILHIPQLTSIFPNYINMVFNTALCFVLAGLSLCLSQTRHAFLQKTLPLILGSTILILSSLILSQTIFNLSLGIDQFFIKINIVDQNPFPGRMALNTSIAFILAGLIFIFLPYAKNRIAAILIQCAIFIVFMLGLTALLGYLLKLEFLYGWYRYSLMAIHTAMGITILGIGLTSYWNQHENCQHFYQGKEDWRVVLASSAILFCAVYVAGITGFSTVAKDNQNLLKETLQRVLQGRINLFQSSADRSVQSINVLASTLQSNIDEKNLHGKLAVIGKTGFSAITIFDKNNQPIYKIGNLVANPSMQVPIKLPYSAQLLWKNGWFIQYKIQSTNNQQVGQYIIAEWPLTEISQLFSYYQGLGETGEYLVCAPYQAKTAICFPTRLTPHPFVLNLFNKEGTPRAIFYALSGQQGIKNTIDYRDHSVIAAYSPLNKIGLGVVSKIDSAEIYRPIQNQLKRILLIFVLTVFIGMLVIYWQVRPLLRRVILSEKQAKQDRAKLAESESRIRAIMDNIAEGILILDGEGKIISCNPKIKQMFGYKEKELIGQPVKMLMAPSYRQIHENDMRQYRESGKSQLIGQGTIVIEGMRKNQELFIAELAVAELTHNGQKIYASILRDISERKAIENALQESEQRFHSAFAGAAIGMALVSLDGHWIRTNQALTKITGYVEQELLCMDFRAITYPEDLDKDLTHIQQLLSGKINFYQIEKRFHHKDGKLIWVLLSVSLVCDKNDKPLYFVVQIQDIDRQKKAEEQLTYQAFHDPLTGLANRAQLESGVNMALSNAKRHHQMLAVLYLDLDKFKEINDHYGHDTGDLLLKHIAKCLQTTLRSTDIIARLGGDEFVIALTEINSLEDIIIPVEKIINLVTIPVILREEAVTISTSIGISLYPQDGDTYQELTKKADQALYDAKNKGRNRYNFYNPKIVSTIKGIEHD